MKQDYDASPHLLLRNHSLVTDERSRMMVSTHDVTISAMNRGCYSGLAGCQDVDTSDLHYLGRV